MPEPVIQQLQLARRQNEQIAATLERMGARLDRMDRSAHRAHEVDRRVETK